MYHELKQIIRRSAVVKLSILERKYTPIYNNLHNQLLTSINAWTKYSIDGIPNNLIYINYIYNDKDVARVKELFETNKNLHFLKLNTKFIDVIKFLLIGYVILYPIKEFYEYRYNKSNRYVELVETFIKYIGIGTRLLKKVASYNKKKLMPYDVIKTASEFWFKYLHKKLRFTSSKSLKIYCKENAISFIKWEHLYTTIDTNYNKIVKEFSTKYVAKLINLTI